MNRNWTLLETCERIVTALMTALAASGYRVERSFDLRSALKNHTDCPCPHHYMPECACQYLVLLVYEVAAMTPPALVTAHECDGVTRLRAEAGRPGGRLSPKLAAALDEALCSTVVDA